MQPGPEISRAGVSPGAGSRHRSDTRNQLDASPRYHSRAYPGGSWKSWNRPLRESIHPQYAHRTRDRAELVTDDAWKLADQLQKATGEGIAALDGVALQAAHKTVFGVDDWLGRERGHAPAAIKRGRSATRRVPLEDGREPGSRYITGRSRDGSLPEPGVGGHRSGRDSGGNGRGIDLGLGHARGPGRGSANEKAMEPAPKSLELDLEM